uniref:Uncharacterized protein n=1 Tax=Anguilla anguilla TaxID=7936 RepID=A0A0E9XZJ4_ANGAN
MHNRKKDKSTGN